MNAAGYIIPQVVDPASYRCIKVYVPNDTLYLAAFWNAYEYFAKWAAWERDAAHRGRDAAAVWRIGYDMARDAWEAGEDCDMPFQLRQNPDDLCQLQQSSDGGETWTLAFDYRLCSGAVTLPPPYPGSDTGAEDAAAEVLRDIWIGILNIVDDSPDKPTFIGNATEIMRLYDPGWSNPGALGDVWDAYNDLTITEQEAYKDECIYFDKFTEMSACFSPEGAIDYLNCWSEMLGDWLNDTSDELMTALNQVAATLTGNGVQAAAGGGAGGGAGFGADCWTHVFDFLVSNGGWVKTTHPEGLTDRGSYGGGGWAVEPQSGVSTNRYATIKSPDIAPTVITYAKMNYTLGGGGVLSYAALSPEGYPDWLELAGTINQPDGDYEIAWTGAIEITHFLAYIRRNDNVDAGWITRIELRGQGVDPF